MQLTDDRLRYSPSDLSGFLACRHLTRLETSVARGERKRPVFEDPHREILGRKGVEHEAAYLAKLEEYGARVLRLPVLKREEPFDRQAAQRLSEEAIRSGTHDVLYQAYLADGDWQGFADFLERREDGTYEPVDAKLARATRPEHLLQLCFYAEQIQRIQGKLPERIHAQLGSGERESFRTADYMAYYRRVRASFLAAVSDPAETYPWPCERCGICSWRRECHQKLVDDDSLILVAGLGRTYVPRFQAAGLLTLEKLGDAPEDHARDGIPAGTFERFRHQAELQLARRRTGEHRVELLDPEPGRGFAVLPQPSPGDLWLDLEGHPFFEPARSLEYLFGYCLRVEGGGADYRALWARDRESEKKMFEDFVDLVVERRRRFPDMHIYHYAAYERSALQRLMGEHGTREEEIDDLLRGEVLVDLYRVVEQSLRASVESYSLKKVEALYGFERQAEVRGGAESTVLFDQWLELRDQSLLDEIERYNEEDCRSTFALHEWLLSIRPADTPWRPLPAPATTRGEAQVVAEEKERVQKALLARSSGEGDDPWLVAQLLDYHKREARPQWWHWFNRLEMDDEALLRDTSTMGGLMPLGDRTAEKRSHVYTFAFPAQDHKIERNAVDPATGKGFRTEVDEENGIVRVKRDQSRASEPLPKALVPGSPIPDHAQRQALLRFAQSYLAGDGTFPALVDVLERRVPQVDLTLEPPEAALTLTDSYLFVQGPPGSGKTWQGAKAAVALMRAGKRIGVTSLSHKGINKLLEEIEREAQEQSFSFRGRKKFTDEEDAHRGPFIDASARSEDLLDRSLNLVAGTGWLFAPEEFDHTLDVLFIDEAGQVSLADALASATAARSLVLLGDPNQLPQVSQGVQPEAAKKSVLEHLLGEHHTVPPDRGIFLEKTWRLRPELCAFNSEAYYDGRLAPASTAEERSVAAGNGLHVKAVPHEGRSQSSREEAEAVAAEIARLLETPYTDGSGTPRPLKAEDVLVVTPYNAQVRMIRQLVPQGVRVGTVDKFQGQEAAVVLVSFASSSGADAPRGIGFTFEAHRVNVATSRGQCRVVIFCSPDLLRAECRSVEQMRLMNAICRFVEMARAE
ncbi:MAG TPA: TM0106 family RecB-like putative nuclease [Candidatus Eisenbacteria bacterium]|nr:TM0106 family RecB-like putative nuclease [Candidatus Eisenbacteria bacterium]